MLSKDGRLHSIRFDVTISYRILDTCLLFTNESELMERLLSEGKVADDKSLEPGCDGPLDLRLSIVSHFVNAICQCLMSHVAYHTLHII